MWGWSRCLLTLTEPAHPTPPRQPEALRQRGSHAESSRRSRHPAARAYLWQMQNSWRSSVLVTLLLIGVCGHAAAQVTVVRDGIADVQPGSERETYLRVLALRDSGSGVSWTMRALSPGEVGAVIRATRGAADARGASASLQSRTRATLSLATPTGGARFNSAFPYGSDDGPIWAGRGATAWAAVGATLRWGHFSMGLHPVAWHTSNGAFTLAFEDSPAPLRYRDALHPTTVDRPQRFGDKAVGRVDPGYSFARLDARLVSFGVSTSPQAWGPASFFPFLLGTNAPGFAHIFAGSGAPWNLYVVRLRARVIYGRLTESPYAFHDSIGVRDRFASGAILGIGFPAIPGLEIGAGRFFHTPVLNGRRLGRSDFMKPFEGFLKQGLGRVSVTDNNGDLDNQLASVFGTWRFPASGAELYFEFGREDHSYDLRDLILEPDHTGTRLYGIRKNWSPSDRSLWSLRAETFNAEATQAIRVRAEGAAFLGTVVRQGHTNRGQLLAADVGPGSAAAQTISLDRYSRTARAGFRWTRKLRGEPGTFQATGKLNPRTEVLHSLTADVRRNVGPVNLTVGLTGIRYFGRNLRNDKSGISLVLEARPRVGAGW